jgi:hypothetical protein
MRWHLWSFSFCKTTKILRSYVTALSSVCKQNGLIFILHNFESFLIIEYFLLLFIYLCIFLLYTNYGNDWHWRIIRIKSFFSEVHVCVNGADTLTSFTYMDSICECINTVYICMNSKLCKIKIQRSLGSISPKFNIDYWQEACLKSFYDKSTIKTQLYFAWNIKKVNYLLEFSSQLIKCWQLSTKDNPCKPFSVFLIGSYANNSWSEWMFKVNNQRYFEKG